MIYPIVTWKSRVVLFANGIIEQIGLLYGSAQSFLQVTPLQFENALDEFVLLPWGKIIFKGCADMKDRSREYRNFGTSLGPRFGVQGPVARKIGNGDYDFFVQKHFVCMRKADAAATDVNEGSINRILHTAMCTRKFYLNGKWYGDADEPAHLNAFNGSEGTHSHYNGNPFCFVVIAIDFMVAKSYCSVKKKACLFFETGFFVDG